MFNFETKASYQVRILTTDSEGASFEKSFTITVADIDEPINQPPTNIALEGSTIAENATIGTLVGTLSAEDVEDGPNAAFVYALVEGEGDSGNEFFSIPANDNQLLTAAAFNTNDADTVYQVRIQVTDSQGSTFAKIFGITVTNVDEPANQPPTNITLSSDSIAEKQLPGTLVGTLSAVDDDDTEGFTYQKIEGDGDRNNQSFRIRNDSLFSDERFDFIEKNTYEVRIQTTDPAGNLFAKSFTIFIRDIDETVNQPPTDIRLDNATIAENEPAGSLVGKLFTTDLDNDDGFTYALTAGEGNADNASFRIRENQLLTNASFDFETKQRYQVRITTTDTADASFANAFTILVTDINEDTNQAPTDLILSNDAIAENEPFNSEVGRFTVVDPDASDRHTVTLVEGDGDGDNGRFQIRDNVLYSLVSFDFEGRNAYSIRVQGRDSQQATITEMFTISVTDVADNNNQPPTNILLSTTQVSEGQLVNLVVGTFTATDADADDTHTFTLVVGDGDDDNATFSIAGTQLQTAQVFNVDAQARYRIRVRADDGRGGTLEKPLTITVVEGENNAPTVANPVADIRATVGELFSFTLPDDAFADADASDVLTYTVTLDDGTPLPGWLMFAADTRILSGTPPEDSPDSLVLEVAATDSRGAFVSDQLILTITRVTAVEDEISATWTVYPVPTDQRFLTVKAPSSHEPLVQLRLLDTSGRLVKRYRIQAKHSAEYVLSLPETLSTGTYFLEIRTSGYVGRKRIMLR